MLLRMNQNEFDVSNRGDVCVSVPLAGVDSSPSPESCPSEDDNRALLSISKSRQLHYLEESQLFQDPENAPIQIDAPTKRRDR